jgi:hypothetical protein
MAALVNLRGFVRGTELLDHLSGHNLLHTARCLRAMSILRFSYGEITDETKSDCVLGLSLLLECAGYLSALSVL